MSTPATKKASPFTKEEGEQIKFVAKLAFRKMEPFLAQFSATRDFEVTAGAKCYTDGKRIRLGAELIKKLPRGHVFCYAHEVWHIALNHPMRFKSLSKHPDEHHLYNILTDLKINQIVWNSMNASGGEVKKYKEYGLIHPDNIETHFNNILKPEWKDAIANTGVSLDDVDIAYRALRPHLIPGSGGGHGPIEEPNGNESSDDGDGDPIDWKQVEIDIKKSIASAKLRGASPGSMNSDLKDLWDTERVDWRQILSNAIQTRLNSATRTWSRFNRRD
jgi:predicted metal-dependent peptidase